MLAPGTLQIGWGHANAVWALMSNFIALDRLSATFGAATAAPGQLLVSLLLGGIVRKQLPSGLLQK